MDNELERLYAELSSGQPPKCDAKLLTGNFDKKSKNRGVKKRYFESRADLIFKLVECLSASYNDVLAALSKDGVDFSYIYFRELMAAEKSRRKQQGITPAQASSRPVTPETSATMSTTPVLSDKVEKGTDLPPEKAALKAEIERIRELNINSREKREMITKATEAFSKTQNPLDRK